MAPCGSPNEHSAASASTFATAAVAISSSALAIFFRGAFMNITCGCLGNEVCGGGRAQDARFSVGLTYPPHVTPYAGCVLWRVTVTDWPPSRLTMNFSTTPRYRTFTSACRYPRAMRFGVLFLLSHCTE